MKGVTVAEIKWEEFHDNEDYINLIVVIDDIEGENDFSDDAYEDIRFFLRPFEWSYDIM